MKNLKKITTGLLGLALLFSLNINAQEFTWGGSVEGAVPMFAENKMIVDVFGFELPINAIDFGSAEQMGVGFGGHINYKFNEKAAFTARAGRTTWDVLANDFLQAKVTAIPILIGGKYYIVDGLYAGLEGGAQIVKTKLQTDFLLNITLDSNKETLFSIGPNVGYELNLGPTKLDLSANYMFVQNKFNYAGIKAAIMLPYKG